MPKTNESRNWKDNKSLAHSLIRKYITPIHALDNSWEYKDLMSVAAVAFVQTLKDEQDNKLKCKFSTALYTRIQTDLMDILRVEQAERALPQHALDPIEDYENLLSYDTTGYHYLSEEAKEVLYLLKDTPSELVELSRAMGLKEAITRYLKIYKGWKPRKLDNFWQEVKEVMKEDL